TNLSQDRRPARYQIPCSENASKNRVFSKRKRQVIDTLMKGPVFCASTVRVGDVVFRLKEDDDLHCLTETLPNGRKYYRLPDGVRFLGLVETEAAA
ncbi:MAG: hypothetical protein AAF636_21885, partial [Pseudomonadota bacterium]